MSGIQWTKAAWGGSGAVAAGLARSFTLGTPVTPLVAAAAVERHRRIKLWELAATLHCSIVGTCLTTSELRHLLVKLGLAHADVDDHDAHKIGVSIAGRHDLAGKKLHKLLDERHRAAIARFARATTPESVRQLWKEALRYADIPGAYWASLTHPATGHRLASEAFGDVHMLSHLVGASNRADISRLRALEDERASLLDRLDRQQARLRDTVLERDATIADLRTALATRPEADRPAIDAEHRALRAAAAEQARRLAAETARRQAADEKLAAIRTELQRERAARMAAEQAIADLHADIDTLERHLPDTTAAVSLPDLGGLAVLYVGGRPTLLATLRGMAARVNVTLLEHDGGVEDSDGTLARLIGRADIVLFPVDCVSHRAVGAVKRGCVRGGKPFRALRSASASAFLACIARLQQEGPRIFS